MAKSNKKRYQDIQARIGAISVELEELRDEMSDALDNVPENLQNSHRYYDMENRLDAINQQIENLDELFEFDWDDPS